MCYVNGNVDGHCTFCGYLHISLRSMKKKSLKSGFEKYINNNTPVKVCGNAVKAEISHFITPEVLSNAHLWFKLKAHSLEVHLIFKECPNSPSLRSAKASSQLHPCACCAHHQYNYQL